MTSTRRAMQNVVPLCDLAEIRTGLAVGKSIKGYAASLPYLRVANVQDGWIDLNEVKQVRVEASAVERYRLRKGDVLLTEGGDIDKLGRGAVWQGQIDPCIHQNHVFAVRPNPRLLDSAYLAALASSDYGRNYFLGCAKRTTNLASINSSQLKAFPVIEKTIGEQKQIAAVLTAVDDRIDVLVRQLEATQALKQSLLQTLFSKGVGSKGADGRWAGHTAFVKVGSSQYPESWRMKRMGEIAPLVRREVDVQPGENYPELGLRSFGRGTFHKPALTGEQVGSKRLFLIKAGDLLLSNVFAWEGAVAVAGPADDGRYGSHRYITCKVDPEIANVHFVARYLVTPAGLASIGIASPGGAGRNKTLGLAALAEIQIPLPPLAEQNAVNEVLECVEAKIAVLQAKHELYRDLKRGLMQKLLTGEWRVKADAEMAA